MRQHILIHTFARLLRPSFLYQCCALFHEDEYIQEDTHTYVSTRAWASFLCGAKMLHRHLRALIAASLLSKTVASTTYLHTPFSAPKTYMCICASLFLKKQTHLIANTSYICMYMCAHTHMYLCTCVHILICTCIRLLTATVLDKCLHVCRAASLQDKMHSIISQCVRVQYSSHTY
jgi:hypothetical protein